MKKKVVKRLMATLLATVTIAASLSACGQQVNGDKTTETQETTVNTSEEVKETETAPVEIDKSKLPVLSLYPANANLTSGLVDGFKSDMFAENGFQLEVWAYSDEKTNAILTSGDLPDIMYVKVGETLDTLIETGKILDLTEYFDQIPHLYDNEYMEGALANVKENRSAGTGKVYCLPVGVGDQTVKYSWSSPVDRNTVKIRWDVYEEIGAPEIKDYWDLIDVMEEMYKAHPTEADGTKVFGTFLDNGKDTVSFGAMELWYKWQGYQNNQLKYMLEVNYVTDEYTSILTEDSKYYEGLKWYNEVYRRGLMDPDSINTDRATQAKKVDLGLALVPSGTLPGYAPFCYEYYIPGTQIWYDNCNEIGNANYVIAINAETEYLDECLALLDMWCNPDDVFELTMGPEGDLWYKDGEAAYLTEEFEAHLASGEANGYNGFLMSDGSQMSTWNTEFVTSTGTLTTLKDGEGNYRPASLTVWDEYQEYSVNNDTFKAWQETTGYTSYSEWLEAENALHTSSAVSTYNKYWSSKAPEELELIIAALRDVVVTASWNMVYAESDEEFNNIWNKMVKDCEELKAQDVINWRLSDIEAARAKAGVK